MPKKVIKWISGFIGLVGLSIIVLATTGWLQTEAITQPIKFNHLKHQEQNLRCLDCHKYSREYKFAGLPNIETCSECHQDKLTESQEEEKLIKFIQANSIIPWNRIYQIPDHVYYSHAEHVGLANLECQNCHGNIGESKTPPKRPWVKFSMKFCMGCHKKQKASLDCLACHI
jgi:hypothetical protein